MRTSTKEALESGWLPTTPVDDTVLRRFLYNQADVNEILTRAASGTVVREDAVVLTDAGSPVALLNQALLTAPVLRAEDPVLDDVDQFFAGSDRPATVLSVWPTPDFSKRGWTLLGHPVFVVRPAGPVVYERRPDVEVCRAPDLTVAERVVVEGFPFDEARGVPGALFGAGLDSTGLEVRLALLDGEPVAAAQVYVGHGVANLCMAATLPAARRRGVWEALVWERVASAPDQPAAAYTSDASRPGFVRMGFLPLTRFTLWHRPADR